MCARLHTYTIGRITVLSPCTRARHVLWPYWSPRCVHVFVHIHSVESLFCLRVHAFSSGSSDSRRCTQEHSSLRAHNVLWPHWSSKSTQQSPKSSHCALQKQSPSDAWPPQLPSHEPVTTGTFKNKVDARACVREVDQLTLLAPEAGEAKYAFYNDLFTHARGLMFYDV